MAPDIQDWTTAVNITGGSVSISGTATVTISGTPSVNIAGTPAVTVASGTVSIGNTPAVTISGTPTVILGGGTASVGSVSAINSTVTVAGTVSISGTPTVTISGTVSVSIVSGSVSIVGTAGVNIVSQSVSLSVSQPQTSLGNFVVPAGPGANNATYALPSGTHAVGILVSAARLSNLTVQGVTTGINYIALAPATGALSGYFVCPVLSALDTSVKISGTTAVGQGPTTVYAVAILDAEGVFIFDNTGEPATVSLATGAGTPVDVIGLPGNAFSTQQGLFVVTAHRRATASYRAAASFVAAATATDIWAIASPATKTIRLRRIRVDGIQTTGSHALFQLVKRSTRDTLGTFVPGVAVPMDSSFPAATAVVGHYTANPTLGTLVGIFQSRRIYMAPNATSGGTSTEWTWGDLEETSAPVLNTVGEEIAINLGGATFAGNAIDIEVEWTEE